MSALPPHRLQIFFFVAVLAASQIPAGRAEEPAVARDHILQSLEWTVAEDGSARKSYRVRYEGVESLTRLKDFAGGPGTEAALDWVENLLPGLERQDKRVSRASPAAGEFEFVYASPPREGAASPRSNLLLWLPSWDDPTALVWRSVEGSRLRYDHRPLELVRRLRLKGPWRLPGGLEIRRRKVGAGGVEAVFDAEPIEGGFQVEIRVTSSGRELDPASAQVLEEDQREWLEARLLGTLVAGIPGKEEGFRQGAQFEVGYGRVNDQLGGWNLGLGYRVERRYSRNWLWKIAALDFNVIMGSEPDATDADFSLTGLSLSSGLEYRIPYFSESRRDRSLTFVELWAAPRLQHRWFERDTGGFDRGWHGAWEAGVRWGQADARASVLTGSALRASISLRGLWYFDGGVVNNAWGIFLETLQ